MKASLLSFAMLALTVPYLVGCGTSTESTVTDTTAPATDVQGPADDHDHSDWWCNEHGVPEEVCALCDSSIAAEFQKSGDWCQDHNRPDSQCFACHPELQAQFAAKYEARYGTQPPKPEG